MLQSTTEPVKIVGYVQPTDREDKPITWKDGTAFENVQFTVDGEDRYRELALDPSINGSRPEVGSVVTLTLASRPFEQARTSAAGRPYIHRSYKERVVGTTPAK